MSDAVVDYLQLNGPTLSSVITEYLVQSMGLSSEAARKRVSRTRGDVRRLAHITFPRKARFIYLKQQFGSPDFWTNLVTALRVTRSAYGHAIAAMMEHDGVVPERLFPIICGAPIKQQKHLAAETICSRLIDAKIFQRVTLPTIGSSISLVQGEGHYDAQGAYVRARLITESILLTAVKDWLRKLGIVSYGQVATRDDEELPRVGTFAWDLTAPSYLGHMVRFGSDGNPKPGFVVCDVHLDKTLSIEGVWPFVHKCRTLRSLPKIGACMQIFVADKYEPDAFALLKENGIIPATIRNLFGEEIAEGLSQLTSVLHNAATVSLDPVKFDDLFTRLNKIEGASNQLRGTLFEFLAAELARQHLSHNVRMNSILKANGKEAEADVIAVQANKTVTFIECKGYSPYGRIPLKHMERWLQHNVPVFYAYTKAHPEWKNLKIEFEFWATAPLEDEAIAMFTAAAATIKPSRYTVRLRTNPDIALLCKATNDDGLLTAFQKHYQKAG